MSSRRKQKNKNNHNNSNGHEISGAALFAKIQQARDDEISNFSATVLTLEQRYAHFISAALDVKKRICMEVFNNKIQRITDLCDKALTLMNTYYQQQIQQLKQEKRELTRKNHKHQKLIQQYQSQNIDSENSKKKRKKKRHHKKHKKSKQKHNNNNNNTDSDNNTNTTSSIHPNHNNTNTNTNNKSNDGPNDIITDIIMNDNYAQLQSPFIIHDSGNENTTPEANNNNQTPEPKSNINFHAMPTFNIASISKMNSTTITNNNNTDHSSDDSDSSDNSSDYNSNTDSKRKIKKDIHSHHKTHKKRKRHKHKHRHKKRKIKKEKFKYKYRKANDPIYYAPARTGNTDKTWLYCNHKRANGSGVCGVKFIRTLKDREDQAQHYCDGDDVQKLITRKFGNAFTKCTYCDGINPCTRLAVVDEIQAYQQKIKQLNIVPNTYGGYKVMGAKQTKGKFNIPPRTGVPRRGRKTSAYKPPKKRSRVRNRNHNRKRSRSSRSNNKNKTYARKTLSNSISPQPINNNHNNTANRAKSLGIESVLPQLNDNEATPTIWDDDNMSTVSDINIENKPLQRRSRKRKRREFESDCDMGSVSGCNSNSSMSDSFVEQELKKQKLDRSELRKLDLDSLVSKAFMLKSNEESWWENNWCRYCGARGSTQWLNSPWGDSKLCKKHGDLWGMGQLDLDNYNEPMDRESVVDKELNTECEFLIDLIDKEQKIRFKAAAAISIDGKRRSLRNIKKERIYLNEESSDDSDSSYGSSSDESQIPIAERIALINHNRNNNENNKENNINVRNENGIVDIANGYNINGHVSENDKENGVIDISGMMSNVIENGNGNGNVAQQIDKMEEDQSNDEDDDILGVD